MPSLFVIRGNDQGVRFELDSPQTFIGRGADNPIQLHDTEASRRHAEVRKVDDSYLLIDLGSSNGTIVNNRRVLEHELESGDEVRIGGTVMLFSGGCHLSAINLADRIEMVGFQNKSDEQSHIVSSLSHKPGANLFGMEQVDNQSSWLKNALNNFDVMYRTVLAVSHTIDIDQLLSKIMQLIFEWVECDRGCILLTNRDTDKLETKAVRHRKGRVEQDQIRISKSIVDYVTKKIEGVISTDARDDSRWNGAESILRQDIQEAICIPMQGRYNNLIGLVYLDTVTPQEYVLTHGTPTKFNEEHLKLMMAIGHLAGIAVENATFNNDLLIAERMKLEIELEKKALIIARDKAEELSRAKDEFLSTVSHELRQPLNAILGYAQLLVMSPLNSQQQKEIQIILDATTRLDRLVGDLLQHQSILHGIIPLSATEIELDIFSQALIEEFRTHEKAEQISLELDLGEDSLGSIQVDEGRLHQVLSNLLRNALEHTHEGSIRLSVRRLKQQVLFQVIDSGEGMPKELVDQLFQAFVTHPPRVGTKQGNGLGLMISKRLLKAMGGDIYVESEVGKGSTFVVTLSNPEATVEQIDKSESPPSDTQDPFTTTQFSEQQTLYGNVNPYHRQ